MDFNLKKAKSYLQDANYELEKILLLLDDILIGDGKVYQKENIKNINYECEKQIRNLTNSIIPADTIGKII